MKTPQLMLAKAAGAAALLAALFIGGCNLGQKLEEADTTKAESKAMLLQNRVWDLQQSIHETNRLAEQNKAQAEQAKKHAEEQAKLAAENKARLDKERDKWSREFEKLKSNPDCKRVLEMKLCPSITSF